VCACAHSAAYSRFALLPMQYLLVECVAYFPLIVGIVVYIWYRVVGDDGNSNNDNGDDSDVN